jgi:DNA-binding HxlR family transcriptional regulator
MVHREVIPEKPPKTVYSLTAFGESIVPVLDAMCQWGTNYMDGLDVQAPCCNAGA